jgi:tetratricopeptide (TPR) repeat protein
MNALWQRRAVALATILTVGGSGLTVAGGASAAPSRAVSANAKCSASSGQQLIDGGLYEAAVKEFECVISANPTAVDGYRGRIEAELMLRRYSDAVLDYTRVAAFVLPVNPGAPTEIHASYADRLAEDPHDVVALTGASFAWWWYFQYAQARVLLGTLLEDQPNDPYANLLRGSSRLLGGADSSGGVADVEHAIALDPQNAHVRFIVADAYTYGLSDPERAFAEASLALSWGLDRPRVHAILAVSYMAFGDPGAAALHLQRSIELATTELLHTAPLTPGNSVVLDLVPGRTYEIPLPATAGEPIRITTSSQAKEISDSIAVLLAPDGTPVTGSDDDKQYLAQFEWIAETTGTYHVQVTSFEAAGTGNLIVKRG